MEQIDIKQLLDDSNNNELLNESSMGNNSLHLYENYKMTFNEMR
jgi:hypothetical protein